MHFDSWLTCSSIAGALKHLLGDSEHVRKFNMWPGEIIFWLLLIVTNACYFLGIFNHNYRANLWKFATTASSNKCWLSQFDSFTPNHLLIFHYLKKGQSGEAGPVTKSAVKETFKKERKKALPFEFLRKYDDIKLQGRHTIFSLLYDLLTFNFNLSRED